jgi:hypothetical protein
MPYKRVPVPSLLPARVLSTVQRPSIGDALEFFSSVHSVSYQALDCVGPASQMKSLWTTGPYNNRASSFTLGQDANQLHHPSARVYDIYECLLALLLERNTDKPLYHSSISRCFDLPRVWLAHGGRISSDRYCKLEINCSTVASSAFFRDYARLASEFGVVAQEQQQKALDFRGLVKVSVAEAAAAFFPQVTLVTFHRCNLRAIGAFLRNAPRVTRATIDSGRQLHGDTEDGIMLCGGVEFVETCLMHPALCKVLSSTHDDGYDNITKYLTMCIQDRRSMGTLIELDAPSLEDARHAQPGCPCPTGVASFFRHPLFERNVLTAVRGFCGAASASLLVDSIAIPPLPSEWELPKRHRGARIGHNRNH